MKFALSLVVVLAAACGGGGKNGPDGGTPDAGPLSTAHCTYEPLPPNDNASGPVTAGPIMAGAAEGYLDMPVGSALGAYTSRAGFLGSSHNVDIRRVEQSGQFSPSVGYETPARARAVAISAGGEKVVIVKAELALAYDGVTYDVAKNLGTGYAGKVIFATSHSHSEWAQYTADSKLGLGLGKFRRQNYDALVSKLTEVAQAAIAAERPAKIGIALDPNFDPGNEVTHDRRGENDALAGGSFKDSKLFVIRVDGTDGVPIAVLPVFGMHGTVLDGDNELASSDSSGAVERAVEESFDSKVVVIHLQGAAGDVSPGGRGGVTCAGNAANDPCYDFARIESIGLLALPSIQAVWNQAGMAMKDSVELSMLTRSIPLGPDPATFTVRDGALSYKPFDMRNQPDHVIWEADGTTIKSPIDEFNAPAGAGLCGDPKMYALFPNAELNGSEDPGECFGPVDNQTCPYRSCIRIEDALGPLDGLFKIGFEGAPLCATTRTVVSALRIGDYVIATLPGEPLTLMADAVRAMSPYPADHTIVVGYANGHIGYLLTPEDWLQGGYEPSINLWGPLEGQYIAEQAKSVMAAATGAMHVDGAAGGTTIWVTPTPAADPLVPAPDPAPMAGMVPSSIPSDLYVRDHVQLAQAQPVATIPRLTSAHFVWIGEDPMSGTPRVTLQHESPAGSGTYVDVVRKSGRPVQDRDLLVTWTPIPLRRVGTDPRTHYWSVEWEAAMPEGAAGTDLTDRAGVPLGKYRFHVTGTGYTVDSSAFTVTPGAVAVAATHGSGNTISVQVMYDAETGYRLMDLAYTANRPVPARKGPFDVTFTFMGGATQTVTGVALSNPGDLEVDGGANAAMITSVQVTDPFGNVGTGSL